jgi:hypothetical protein
MQLTQAGWMALGKIPNPMTGKIDRHLESARMTIDMLGALESRTRGNLEHTEKALLERSLRELRLNYVDEVKKGEVAAAPAPEAEAQEKPGEASA